jgi:transcriptional regulator with XRE-family HTH domain
MHRPVILLDWLQIYEEVKLRGQFEADAQLADSLGLTRAQISAWRTGKSELGTLVKLKLLDALGMSDLRSVLHSLYPARNRDELIRCQARLVERVNRMTRVTEHPACPDESVAANGGSPWMANAVLAVLSEAGRADLAPHLERVKLSPGLMNEHSDTVYFPTTAILSIVFAMDVEGQTAGLSIGHEGCLGARLFFGDCLPAWQVAVQREGHALRLGGEVFRAALAKNFALQQAYLNCSRTVTTRLLEQMSAR